jgi:hexosaminidase
MLYPRLAALSEAVWSQPSQKDWVSFSNRLPNMLTRYESAGVNYAKSSQLVQMGSTIDLDSKAIQIALETELPNSNIRYALNSADILKDGQPYNGPLNISETTLVKAAVFKDGKPVYKVTEKEVVFHKAVGKTVNYIIPNHEKYGGSGKTTLTDVIQGSANFGDGKWQAWLDSDMEVILDLGEQTQISSVSVGCLENQGPDIYFPIVVEASLSNDGQQFEEVGSFARPFKRSADISIQNFTLEFTPTLARYVKVKAVNMKNNPRPGHGVWLFVDEIQIN